MADSLTLCFTEVNVCCSLQFYPNTEPGWMSHVLAGFSPPGAFEAGEFTHSVSLTLLDKLSSVTKDEETTNVLYMNWGKYCTVVLLLVLK